MDTNRLPKQAPQYNQKDEGTQDDQGRDGGTNFIFRIEEQETRLTLQEHNDDGEETDTHTTGEIRTCNRSKQPDTRLRPRGYRDRRKTEVLGVNPVPVPIYLPQIPLHHEFARDRSPGHHAGWPATGVARH